jgi:hypothetical protein
MYFPARIVTGSPCHAIARLLLVGWTPAINERLAHNGAAIQIKGMPEVVGWTASSYAKELRHAKKTGGKCVFRAL